MGSMTLGRLGVPTRVAGRGGSSQGPWAGQAPRDWGSSEAVSARAFGRFGKAMVLAPQDAAPPC